jgi:hypothetical protein
MRSKLQAANYKPQTALCSGSAQAIFNAAAQGIYRLYELKEPNREGASLGIMEKLRRGSRTWSKTIVVVEPPRLRHLGMTVASLRSEEISDRHTIQKDAFKIRLALDDNRSREARFLVEKRYNDAGYQIASHTTQNICPERITLATYKEDTVVATITVGFDTGHGLLVDELYSAEIDALRQQGLRVCEFTKLAIDHKGVSKRMIAGLFQVAYLYAIKIWGYSDIVIEVNPSHAPFYQRMLGFQALGEERICRRVDAPALLLRLDAIHDGALKIEKFAGHPELSHQERSLYPYFMSRQQEREILTRIAQG